MRAAADRHIPAGTRHRTLCDVEVAVYDYDSGVERLVLPVGSVFQPWEPRDHWRGERVPITLGDQHARFDWGVTSREGHFLAWDDFFFRCANEEDYQQRARDPQPSTRS